MTETRRMPPGIPAGGGWGGQADDPSQHDQRTGEQIGWPRGLAGPKVGAMADAIVAMLAGAGPDDEPDDEPTDEPVKANGAAAAVSRIVITFAAPGASDMTIVTEGRVSQSQLYGAAWLLDSFAHETRQAGQLAELQRQITPAGMADLAKLARRQ